MRRSSRSTSHRPPRTSVPTCSMGASWNSCRVSTSCATKTDHTAGTCIASCCCTAPSAALVPPAAGVTELRHEFVVRMCKACRLLSGQVCSSAGWQRRVAELVHFGASQLCSLAFHDVADTSRSRSSCRRAATCTTVRFMLAGGEPPGLLGLLAAGGLAGLAAVAAGAGPAICSEYSCRHGKCERQSRVRECHLAVLLVSVGVDMDCGEASGSLTHDSTADSAIHQRLRMELPEVGVPATRQPPARPCAPGTPPPGHCCRRCIVA